MEQQVRCQGMWASRRNEAVATMLEEFVEDKESHGIVNGQDDPQEDHDPNGAGVREIKGRD